MYLEKLEVQGFKSFANKNVLVFPGMLGATKRGITAVVGPNGSGKSNIADCIRWVLGEQSMKTLRGKKSEDVIFSGSDKKGKLGMAEVSLFLNNEDGSAPIDYSQVVLTRRLYRSGESEYLLNNSRVRLADIQILLAKAKFGQKTYSVIGQGMVEDFLNTSLTERKEFFDEATGVKQYQLKRDDSLNKLKASYENLSQAQMLLEEIEPRLKSLTRQVGRLQRRGEIEIELRGIQRQYFSRLWHDLDTRHREFNNDFLELEKEKIKKDKEIENSEKELKQMEAQSGLSEEFSRGQRELAERQREKDGLTKKLAQIEAQLEVKLESQGQFDLAWLTGKRSELEANLADSEAEVADINQSLNSQKERLSALEAEKETLNQAIRLLEKKISELGEKNNDDPRAYNIRLKQLLVEIECLDEMDESGLKKGLARIRQELKEIVSGLEGNEKKEKVEEIQRELLRLSRDKEELSIRIHELNLAIHAALEKQKMLNSQRSQAKEELSRVEEKIRKSENAGDLGQLAEDQERIRQELAIVEAAIAEIKEKISQFSREEEAKRSRLFELQRKMQRVQLEANDINSRLNELRVSAARYEAKLEDLEAEIRESFGDLKEIRETLVNFEEEFDLDSAREKINQLKKQLDLIGGIDPEVEKEYAETKERHDYLSGQINDLTGAIKSLEEIIKELDVTIKERFDKEFKIISEKFEEYFKILFSGGTAKLVKVMESDLEKEAKEETVKEEGAEKKTAEAQASQDLKRIKHLQKHSATGLAGIEIQATPPGKKIKSIAMLSGGERSLIAIAMICAIISSNPSPFVVLDEVDASLDEANSERLARILDDLSHKTQFIVITHNRASMKRANILYGVTMQDDGVSKLLSIKLEEAAENAK